MFMQNCEYAAFWYLQFLCYLTQLQFTISLNEFVEFFLFSTTTAEFGWPERSDFFDQRDENTVRLTQEMCDNVISITYAKIAALLEEVCGPQGEFCWKIILI